MKRIKYRSNSGEWYANLKFDKDSPDFRLLDYPDSYCKCNVSPDYVYIDIKSDDVAMEFIFKHGDRIIDIQ